MKAFLKILIVTAGIISVGYFFFSDITLTNILIKVALVGAFLVCIHLFGLVDKEELRYLQRSIPQIIIHLKRGGD